MSLYESLMEKMEGHPYSNYFSAICVWHDDNRPSLLVYEDGFRCSACGKHGSLQYLEKKIGDTYHPHQVKSITPRFSKWEQENTLYEIALRAHEFLVEHVGYQKYLKRRKLDGFIKAGMFGFREGWITIPVKDRNGFVIDIVTRYLGKDGKAKYVLMGKSDPSPLYSPSWVRVEHEDVIYVPFGMFDSWTLHAVGLASVTYTAGKLTNADLLKPLDKRFVIIPDKGEEQEAYRLVNGLGWRGDVLRIDWPDECKDLQDVREKFGEEKVLELIRI